MGLLDLLQQYAGAQPGQATDDVADHFHEVAQAAPPEAVGQGLAAAFRSDQTPPFAQMVGQLFGRADAQQQTGMVNELLAALGPSVMAAMASGKVQGWSNAPQPTSNPLQGGPGTLQLTPQQVRQITPEQVQQLAEHAERQDPSVIDKISGFYAQHPGLVKTLGGAALTIALSKIARNMRGA